MRKHEDGHYVIKRVVPPGTVNFFFSTLQGPLRSSEYEIKLLIQPIELNILGKIYYVNQINNWHAEGTICTLKNFFETKPRIPRCEYERPQQEYERKIWRIPISLFKDYQFDTFQILDDGFEFDYKHTRINNFVKKQNDQGRVKEIMKDLYKHLREFYKFFAATGGGDIFCISPNGMSEFLNMCSIIDELYEVTDVGVNWNAIKSQQNKDQIYNAKNGICRYEFMEILVRIAHDKYVRNRVCDSTGEACEMLIKSHLLSVFNRYDSNKWRLEKYAIEETDLVLKAHKSIFDAIYKLYSGKKTLPGKKPFVSVEEFRTLCNDANFVKEGFTNRECDVCYSQSMMTQVDDLYKNRHLEMSYVEFLEAVCRAIDTTNLPKIEENGNILETRDFPLKLKITNSIPNLLKLCPQDVKNNFLPPNEETYFKMMYQPKLSSE